MVPCTVPQWVPFRLWNSGASLPHRRKLPEKQALGGTPPDVRSKVTFPTWLLQESNRWYHCLLPCKGLTNVYSWLRLELKGPALHQTMCMEIGNVSGVATNLDKRRGNTVAGQRLLVKAWTKRGDSLTHSLTVTGCQGRCSLRHPHLKADGAIHVEFSWKWDPR